MVNSNGSSQCSYNRTMSCVSLICLTSVELFWTDWQLLLQSERFWQLAIFLQKKLSNEHTHRSSLAWHQHTHSIFGIASKYIQWNSSVVWLIEIKFGVLFLIQNMYTTVIFCVMVFHSIMDSCLSRINSGVHVLVSAVSKTCAVAVYTIYRSVRSFCRLVIVCDAVVIDIFNQ